MSEIADLNTIQLLIEKRAKERLKEIYDKEREELTKNYLLRDLVINDEKGKTYLIVRYEHFRGLIPLSSHAPILSSKYRFEKETNLKEILENKYRKLVDEETDKLFKYVNQPIKLETEKK